ncbi:helix-turn-helix domain-containing protein [Clostridium tyrobutyricum]|uniref:helix-turn-helix domain-containing protein n=1 Tax=Clostridium tyrobutyricum TaxID=1519 RepID=UPI001C380061|nr:helix-turn-helix domain-containing protein [Clostridium tyrobutyricum]MBV4450716.1 helix-turn-helix domain-containing protein [Clostridium tyrobutyricum]
MKRLALLRKEYGMSQAELAEKLGVTQQTISKYENGTREPDSKTLKILASMFNTSIDYLLGNSDNKNTPNSDITPAEKISKLVKDNKIETLAAHFDGEDLTDDDVEDIKKFIEFVVQKRKNKNK